MTVGSCCPITVEEKLLLDIDFENTFHFFINRFKMCFFFVNIITTYLQILNMVKLFTFLPRIKSRGVFPNCKMFVLFLISLYLLDSMYEYKPIRGFSLVWFLHFSISF